MQVEVYADVVFGINLVMDFFIFWIVSKLVKKKVSFWRLLAGGFTASFLYCLLMFMPGMQKYYGFAGSFFMILPAIWVAFGPKTWKEWLKVIIYVHIAAFAVGGIGIALFYFTNLSSSIGNLLSVSINQFPVKILITTTALAYILIKLGQGYLQGILVKKQTYIEVTVLVDGIQAKLTGLLDTGNSLYDPLTDSPVLIAEFKSIRSVLPDEIKMVFYENKENDLSSIQEITHEFTKRIRMIPFSSLGQLNGMLIGFKPDKVIVHKDEKDVEKDRIIIGIYNEILSKEGTYDALLSPMVFSEEL